MGSLEAMHPSSENVPLLSLRNVTKSYGPQRVLTIDSLDLHRHERILLHGRNGFGKSTLLRILGGISTLAGGSISRHPLLNKLRLGFLPQVGGLYADLTVRENLHLRRQIYGLTSISPTGVWYVEELRLERYLDRRVSELSGGFQRLAGIAATLHAAPGWLLLDEPLNGVDSKTQELLKERFAELGTRLELCVIAAPSADGDLASTRQIEIRDGRIV